MNATATGTTGQRLLHLWRAVPGIMERTIAYLSLMSTTSDLPIDVVIPAAEKDAHVLPHAIQGVRRNVRHPISEIIVVGQDSALLKALCRRTRVRYVLETDVVPGGPSAIGLRINGVDRSNWIYQQFLKLSADGIVSQAHYLVVDADTVLIRPQVFERGGRIVYNYSDELYQPYRAMFARLIQEEASCPVSFVSHHMLFSVHLLRELKARIGRVHGRPWQEAILQNLDRSEPSGCSEYDTIGQFAFLHHAAEMAIEYWFNLNVSRSKLTAVPLLELQYGGKYKSLSFHSYRSEG